VGYWVDVWGVKVRRSCAKSWAAWVSPLKNTSPKLSKICTSLSSFQSVQKNPLKIQIRYNQTRVASLKKFPYGVHFNIIENEIIIFAVFNTSQSPKKWSKR